MGNNDDEVMHLTTEPFNTTVTLSSTVENNENTEDEEVSETSTESTINTNIYTKTTTTIMSNATTIATSITTTTTPTKNFTSKSCNKCIKVKCIVYKYTNSGTFLKKVNINNTDLCDRIDPTYKKNVIEERNEAMKTKLDEIKYKTLNEIQKVKEDYKKEIIANKSFGYIAIISITVLIAFVLIMDITKLNVFKKFSRKTITKFK